jgi:AP endonuclease-1
VRGFYHILNDVRVQGIPLILETPSFEMPEVWATEIGVLNRMSGAEEAEKDLEDAVVGVTEVVKRVEAAKPKQAKKAPAKKGKKKSKGEQSDEDADDEEED